MKIIGQVRSAVRNAFTPATRMDASDVLESFGQNLERVEQLASRMDAFANEKTGLGTASHDPRTSNRVAHGRLLSEQELEALWLHSVPGRKIVDTPVEDAARAGFRILVSEDETTDKKTEPFKQIFGESGLKVGRKLKKAHRYQRKYGGGAIVLICDDKNRLDEPIDFASLRSIKGLKVFHRFEISPHTTYDDTEFDEKWGETELYDLHPSTPYASGAGGIGYTHVHASRVIPFFGREVDEERKSDYEGWGQPHLEAGYEAIEALGILFETVASKTQGMIYDIYKTTGIRDLLFGASSTGSGRTKLEERVSVSNYAKGVFRAIAVDKDFEEWETRSLDFKGVRELFEIFCQYFSMATDMPLTKLLGQSPAGFNSSDSTGERNYYDNVEGMLKDLYEPALNYLVLVACQAKEGPTDGVMLESWEVAFGDVERPTPLESAEIRKLHTEADQMSINMGVMSQDEGRRRYEQGKYSTELALQRREPEDGKVGGEGGGEVRRQEQMPNGAQMTAIKDIAVSMFQAQLPRASSVGMTGFFLAVSEQEAQKILGLDDPVAVAWLDQVQQAAATQSSSPPPPPQQPAVQQVEEVRADALDWREDYSSTSMMIAFFPPSEWSARCADYTEFPIDELHLTLVYLPDVDDELAEQVVATLTSLAPTLDQLTLGVQGPGAFFNEASIARHLILSGFGLTRLRTQIVAALEQRGQLTRQNYDFNPHLTLGYHDRAQGVDPKLVLAPMEKTWPTFKAGHLAVVRDGKKITIPLGTMLASLNHEEESDGV